MWTVLFELKGEPKQYRSKSQPVKSIFSNPPDYYSFLIFFFHNAFFVRVQSTMAEHQNLFKRFMDSKPYNGYEHLENGIYEIIAFKFVPNQFYNELVPTSLKRNLMAELSNQVVYLPAQIARNFKDDDALLAEINNDGVKRFLSFQGKKSNG